jgi:hypothetical protein
VYAVAPSCRNQNDHGKAKAYQVRQVLAAIAKKEASPMTSTIPDVTHYTYRVAWSGEDDEFWRQLRST